MSAICAGCGDSFPDAMAAVAHARNVHPAMFEDDGSNPLAQYVMNRDDVGCCECHAAIPRGEVYTHRTIAPAINNDISGAAIVEIVCLDCGNPPTGDR